MRQGDLDAAQRSLRLVAEMGIGDVDTELLRLQADVAWRGGAISTGLERIEQSLAEADDMQPEQGRSYRLKARILLASGDSAGAEEAYQQALACFSGNEYEISQTRREFETSFPAIGD
jgi:Flp pilus assembly protein TadD